MKKIFFLVICSLCGLSVFSQNYERRFLLAGASFGVPENGWFELVCEAFNAKPLNRAISGESIKDTAVDMYDGVFYTMEELADIDALIIMHVHDQYVSYTNGIKEDYKDYSRTEIQQYHLGYDYVIKKYKADCESLNKPATIILCTHWHDSRTSYNASIRILAESWDLPLIKWDDNIGFTKNVLDTDGKQPSLKYAKDTQKQTDGITYGWHPLQGKGQYIQQKMAWICMEELEKLYGAIPVSVKVSEKSKMVMPGNKAYAAFSFTGVPPWSLTYSVNGENILLEEIIETPLIIEVNSSANKTTVQAVSVSNNTVENGAVSGEANIYMSNRSYEPAFDTYVHQANKATAYVNDAYFMVKGNLTVQPTLTHARESYVSFNIENINSTDERIVFRAYYYDCVYPNTALKETHRIEIAGNTETYTTLTWNTKPNNFTVISETAIVANELGSYIDWDVTEWVKEQVSAGKTTATFRLRLGEYAASGLLYFYSSESEDVRKPQLLAYPALTTNTPGSSFYNIDVYTDPDNKQIGIIGINSDTNLSLFSVNGDILYRKSGISDGKYTFSLPELPSGFYFLQLQSGNNNKSYKVFL